MIDQKTEAQSRANQERLFDDFMEKETSKLFLSIVPRSEPPEVLKTFLRSAFDTGWGGGTGEVLGTLLTAMMKDKQKPNSP